MIAETRRGRRGLLATHLALSVALGAGWLVSSRTSEAHRGARLVVLHESGSGPDGSFDVRSIDLAALEERTDLAGVPFRARWSGVWDVPAAGTYRLVAKLDGGVRVGLDGRVVLEQREGQGVHRLQQPVDLDAGLHLLEVDYEARTPAPRLTLLWAPPGGRTRSFASAALYPSTPGPGVRRLCRLSRPLGLLAAAAWLPLLVLAAVPAARRRVFPPSPTEGVARDAQRHPWASRLGRLAPQAALLLVVLYAAALRLEALVTRFWHDAPPWARAVEGMVGWLRPDAIQWRPARGFGGDPFSYLRCAREMVRFYDPHVREPLYVFTTKLFLGLTGQHDVAVGLASSFFSVLAVGATYLLGSRLASPWVGLGAAALFAVEPQVIGLSVEGWRDDAFAFFVILSAYALLRLHDEAGFPNALLLGLVAGGACLTRISALSFLLPAHALVLAFGRGPLRKRAEAAAISVLVSAILVGPFLLSCALAFGDPLFSINDHTRFFRARQALAFETPMSWTRYLGAMFRPFQLLDSLLIGLTTYPFTNKWAPLEAWSPLLAPALPWCAVAGLLLFLASPRGRLVLVVLLAALVPFAFTWSVSGGSEWRFTLLAYPFYLVAACAVLGRAATLLRPGVLARAWDGLRRRKRRVALSAAAVAALGLGAWTALNGLYYLSVRESIRAGGSTAVTAGPRDAFFFGDGWYRPSRLGDVPVRFSQGPVAYLWIPLLGGRDHTLTFRVDPFSFDGAPPQTLKVALDGVPVSELTLTWDPKRIGSYTLTLPAALARAGRNRVELRAAYSTRTASVNGGAQEVEGDLDTAFLLWYVRVAPSTAR